MNQLSLLDTDAIVPPLLYSAGYRLYQRGHRHLILLAPDDALWGYHGTTGELHRMTKAPDPDAIANIRAASPL